MTSTWQEPNKNTKIFFAVSKYDSEKGKNLKATKNLTTSLTRTQVGDSTDSRLETCRQLRQDRQHGTNLSGRRAIGILSILQALTVGEFFSELGQVPTEGVNSAPTNTARTELHTAQSHFITRTRVAQGLRIFVSWKYLSSTCHVSLALVCFLLPSFHGLHRHSTTLFEHDEHLGPAERSHCDDLRQSGGFTQRVTPTSSLSPTSLVFPTISTHKNLASPLNMQSRGDCKSSRTPTASGKPVAMMQERGVRAKRTQAEHSRRESLMWSILETRCNVSIRKERTGRSIQEFCFQKR